MTVRPSLSRRGFLAGVGALAGLACASARPAFAGASAWPAFAKASARQAGGPAAPVLADWPEWRGRGRLGVWTETGILDRFSDKGLDVRWRTPLHAGYAGPSVAGGRVFVTDFSATKVLQGIEHVSALDEQTGRVLWSRQWDANYRGLSDVWAIGPAATPTVDTVDADRVYVLGRGGALLCLKAESGDIIWQRDYVREYGTELPPWGMTGAPLVDGSRLVCLVGGTSNATVVSFDKMTGKELWRALPSDSEPGYAQPIIITAGGTRQLIVWHPTAICSLDPATGRVFWEHPFKVGYGMTVPTAVHSGSRLLVSCFYNGSMMLSLDDRTPTARVLWKGASDSEIQTEGLHAVVATPVIQGDYVYGLCSYGQMRCLRADTGERVWETQAVTGEKARWASGQIVRQGDRYFINNDRGDLIIARFTPQGYQEISRTPLIKPTANPGNRRALGAVNWSHPAYANRRIYARNDEEIICASLASA